MLLTSLKTRTGNASQLTKRIATATRQSAFHTTPSRRVPTTATTTTMVAAPYRSYIQPNADAEFPAEAGRYHLYIAYSCPFACRALSARNLKGLQDVVSVSVAHPIFQKTKPHDAQDNHMGWTFVDPTTEPTVTAANGQAYSSEGATADSADHVRFVRDLYELVDKEPRSYTVPLLWDTKKQTIVSNESADILRTFNSGFRELVPSTVDLLPQELQRDMDHLIICLGAFFFQWPSTLPSFETMTIGYVLRVIFEGGSRGGYPIVKRVRLDEDNLNWLPTLKLDIHPRTPSLTKNNHLQKTSLTVQ